MGLGERAGDADRAARWADQTHGVDRTGGVVSHRILGSNVEVLGHASAESRAPGSAPRTVLRVRCHAPFARRGMCRETDSDFQLEQPASAVQAVVIAAQVSDAMRRHVSRSLGLLGRLHRRTRRGSARGRQFAKQELYFQMSQRRHARHLRRQLHLVPPDVWNVRHRGRRRQLQLLGQG